MQYGLAYSPDCIRFHPVSHNLTKAAAEAGSRELMDRLNALNREGIVYAYMHLMPHVDDPANCSACIAAIEASLERERERHGGQQPMDGPAAPGDRPPDPSPTS